MNRQRFLPQALAVLTLARLALLAVTELSPVEAHAALCSQGPELWHPMTGPLLPLLMRVSTTVFGMNEFGVRFFAPLLMLGAGWLVWKMAHGLFDATVAAWAAVLFQVAPVVNVASVKFTNTTLAIAESAALLALLRLALHRPLRFHLHWWAVAGLSMLGFFTDWRLVAFSIAGTASLALTRRGRGALMKWPVLPVLGGCFAMTLFVFLIWNTERGWAAVHFPGNGMSMVQALWHQVVLAYGPVMLLLLGAVLVEATLQRPLTYAAASLLAFAWPLITLDLLCLRQSPWPQAAFAAWLPALIILAAAALMQTERISPRAKVWARSVIVIAAAAQSCLVLQPSFARESTGWRAMSEDIRAALSAAKIDARQCFFVAEGWDLAEPLAYYMKPAPLPRPAPQHPPVHVLPDEDGKAAFPSWPRFDAGKDAAAFRGATLIFITDDESRELPPKLIRDAWPQSRIISFSEITENGRPVRRVKVFACSPAAAADK